MDKKYKNPSVYTSLYWLIQDKKIEPNLLFDFLELFWPTLIKKDGYVFLEEEFTEEEYKRLIEEKSNPEYWINLLTIDEFFSEMSNWEEKSRVLAKTLVSMWTAKLKKDFPEINFNVQYLCNEECGDYGLTFYQYDKTNVEPSFEGLNDINIPNIKESKIEQSDDGLRPGMPKIRKPRVDEIP